MYLWDKAELVGPYSLTPSSQTVQACPQLCHSLIPSVVSVSTLSFHPTSSCVLFLVLFSESRPEFLPLQQLPFHDPTLAFRASQRIKAGGYEPGLAG